ncbi:hypothetical protein CEXT_407801 [Caerostris extrusa]|uniref:Uncharacterized protein n=1 Tax=Caerostris extrusa TaxID=172846 RepID=A0AAV4MS52_CAEEX|nr:hypothetical protein CEXT_407801 [Caerostris extrusa]
MSFIGPTKWLALLNVGYQHVLLTVTERRNIEKNCHFDRQALCKGHTKGQQNNRVVPPFSECTNGFKPSPKMHSQSILLTDITEMQAPITLFSYMSLCFWTLSGYSVIIGV